MCGCRADTVLGRDTHGTIDYSAGHETLAQSAGRETLDDRGSADADYRRRAAFRVERGRWTAIDRYLSIEPTRHPQGFAIRSPGPWVVTTSIGVSHRGQIGYAHRRESVIVPTPPGEAATIGSPTPPDRAVSASVPDRVDSNLGYCASIACDTGVLRDLFVSVG